MQMRGRIAVITMGVKLGNEEKGYTRFLSLSEQLADAGFEVELITSAFQHWEKAQRKTADPALHDYPFKVTFIDEPGYRRNIDIRRLASHRIAAQRLGAHLDNAPPYDLVYCEIPPNDVARRASEYANAHGIPFIVDVNDLWPEAMRMVFDLPVARDILFAPFARDARIAYRNATAVVGTSDEYARHPLAYRPDGSPGIECLTVYVGNELAQFDAFVQKNALRAEKPPGEFWVTYAGTLGTSYDIATMLRASEGLGQRGYPDIRTLVIGSGPDQEQLEGLARALTGNTGFTGYLDYPRMAAYLAHSDILVNSLVKKAPQSIVNKIADYVAAGKPMINTGEDPELKALVKREDIGMNVEAEDTGALMDAITFLFDNPGRREEMGHNARRLAMERFDRATSYQQIIALVARQLNASSQGSTD
jgi:glycosyltransferase involved in cell wall biosynthesis